MSTQWGLYAAASMLVSIPVVVIFIGLSRYLVSGLTAGLREGIVETKVECRGFPEVEQP
jgi:arabinogalactan oligomer/maltooligosaccharide transport system permease protein